MHQLLGDYPVRKPDRGVGRDGNIVDTHHRIRFSPQMEARYGFTIRNSSAEDLFPYLVYFDAGAYTIQCLYLPTATHLWPPLRKGGALTVGMGSDRAFRFMLPPEESESCGFFKLFVSTEFLDLGWIQRRPARSTRSSSKRRCQKIRLAMWPDGMRST
ncbi:hypothetical protein B0H13DRAFT_1675166 [Mycena leptocephala]|nr:hypothetical protein B0H13DRAFT_1675166 [Mycena leptocephala]